MSALISQWRHGSIRAGNVSKPKLVVAHFMLGNTYPFTENDWKTTFDQAEETGLDALALNLGPEDWQFNQARSAYSLLTSSPRKLKLFFSLDMNVLPSSSEEEAYDLIDKIAPMISSSASLLWSDSGRPILSTFGGHDRTFGGLGWSKFLQALNHRLGKKVLFIPSFFMPPNDFLSLPFVDGTFAWNNAWPMSNSPTSLDEDRPFLHSDKPYMAAVSPVFFTHYGTSGPFAFNKNWIYRSDDLLYPTRWDHLLSLPVAERPAIIQVVSWNDHGESHAIAPVLGAQPGSDRWTDGMNHDAFMEMTRYFSQKWKGLPQTVVEEGQVKVWMWYRLHPSSMIIDIIDQDEVGRPGNADWAQDLINLMILVPAGSDAKLHLRNGRERHTRVLKPGDANLLTIPFVPGEVQFEVISSGGEQILAGEGKQILKDADRYNFNMWTGSWSTRK
ncbi:glycoside hydrolase [Naematelia encephala]|uniref:Glycoside hydrolase n=1 Tax=Naematelia encephala TaxID=71784 RepID=A0A1Y2B1P9_9TREE|nr:glycoside hydrolase [Naematelia encephala]